MKFCDRCGASVGGADSFCKTCGTATGVAPAVEPEATTKLSTRYRDSYRVAMVLVGLGTTIKVVGFVVGGLIVFSGLNLGGGGFARGMGGLDQPIAIASIITAGIVTGFFFVIGVLVSSQGQVLRATLDSAVNTSTLLSNSDRIGIMGL